MGRAPQPRRGTNDTGEGQRITNTSERIGKGSASKARKRSRRKGEHEFLITWERVGTEGAKAMEEEGWARFFITWEMVGMEGAEATEEGRGHEFLITWERVGNEGDQAMEEGRGATIFPNIGILIHRNFENFAGMNNTSAFH